MSSTSEALVQMAQQVERIRIALNSFLDDSDKLPVGCTLEDEVEVIEQLDILTTLGAYLNSIEIHPENDYSINDSNGVIKGLRPYAFYNNTALKSLRLDGVTTLPTSDGSYGSNVLTGMSSVETIEMRNLLNTQAISNCPELKHIIFPKLTDILGQYFIASNSTKLENLNLPKVKRVPARAFLGMTSLKTILFYKYCLMYDSYNSNFNSNNLQAFICVSDEFTALTNSSLANEFINVSSLFLYVPSALLFTYQSATNWVTIHQSKTDGQGNYNGIQAIEPNINYLRELGADFSFTPYANKKWDTISQELVTDSTIGEEVE